MDFDVGDKRGSNKFHKEIGPVESGEEGRGGSPNIRVALSSKLWQVESCWMWGSIALYMLACGLGELVVLLSRRTVCAGHFMNSWKKVAAVARVTAIGSVSQCVGQRRPDMNWLRLLVCAYSDRVLKCWRQTSTVARAVLDKAARL